MNQKRSHFFAEALSFFCTKKMVFSGLFVLGLTELPVPCQQKNLLRSRDKESRVLLMERHVAKFVKAIPSSGCCAKKIVDTLRKHNVTPWGNIPKQRAMVIFQLLGIVANNESYQCTLALR